MIDEIITDIKSEGDFLSLCQNRSVFPAEELSRFWAEHSKYIKVIKFIYVKSLAKRPTPEYLWNNEIVQAPYGPRPFTRITDDQFNMILGEAQTELIYTDC